MYNEKEIKFIDLFGGAGGFRLGLERACGKCISPEQGPGNKKRRGLSCTEGGRGRSFKKLHSDWSPADRSENGKGEKNKEGDDEGRKGLVPEKGKVLGAEGRRCRDSTPAEPDKGTPHFECVWYCDNDKYATSVYNRNFNEEWTPTDATEVDTRDVPDFDLLCAGFPCQAFSVAGKRRGFEDTRGTLFFEIARIARAKRPPYLLLENVKGLLNHEKGETYAKILDTLGELGYELQWMVLNSKFFGVPQNRERVFIVGHLGETSPREIFPIRNGSQKINEMEQTSKKLEVIVNLFSSESSDGRVFNTNGLSPTIRPSAFGWAKPKIIENYRIRRLTPVECERLQGFPDNWTKWGKDERSEIVKISDNQRYKMIGNAVTVNVVEAIGTWLLGVM